MSLFSYSKGNNFRVQNKSVPVSCSLNINVVSLLLDFMIKITDFNNYHKSYVHMSNGINLFIQHREDVSILIAKQRRGKNKNFLPNWDCLFAKVPEVTI